MASRQQLVSVWIAILLVGIAAIIGWGSPAAKVDTGTPELTLIQRGNVTVTVTSGTTAGSTTVTYSPAYTRFPSLWLTQTSVSTQTYTIGIPTSQLSFLSSPTTTWTNMPTVATEIFGDANHEHMITVSWIGMTVFRFGVLCVASSNTAGAYLTIQYSVDGGVTWTEVNSLQRYIIDNTNCIGNSPQFGSITPSSIPSAAQTSNTRLRIVGVGGGGIGDTPSFSQLWVEWASSSGSTQTTGDNRGAVRTCSMLAQCSSPQDTSMTQFVVQVTYTKAVTATQTWTFVWTAGLPA